MRFMFFKLNPAAANRGFSDEAAVLNKWGSTFKLSGAVVKNSYGWFEVGHIS